MWQSHKNYIYSQIVKNSPLPESINLWVPRNYLKTPNKFYGTSTKIKRQIAKEFYKQNKKLTYTEFINLLNYLYIDSRSFEEKTIASEILKLYKDHKHNLNLQTLGEWIKSLQGWCEIDSLCQSTFTQDNLLNRWNEWHNFLEEMSLVNNISQKRASLVLLVKSCSQVYDERLEQRALVNLDQLKYETDILITKSVSWLLRSMIKNYRHTVELYLQNNKDVLPKIAIRETNKKLLTGKK